jgi:hypothetical protein
MTEYALIGIIDVDFVGDVANDDEVSQYFLGCLNDAVSKFLRRNVGGTQLRFSAVTRASVANAPTPPPTQ